MMFLVSISLISGLIFIISFLIVLFLACYYFFKSLRCNIRSFIWVLSVFLIYAFGAISFPLSTAFAVSHWFW
jgi:hypothetical protein